jgi:hypothetical protein
MTSIRSNETGGLTILLLKTILRMITFRTFLRIPVLACLFAGCATEHNFKLKVGYVPDAQTAIKIAVAVWEPIYGVEKIAAEKPYRARFTKGRWIVEGSLPMGWNGGVAIAEIAKDDGTVLRVSHGK